MVDGGDGQLMGATCPNCGGGMFLHDAEWRRSVCVDCGYVVTDRFVIGKHLPDAVPKQRKRRGSRT
jgi:transcription initiation factor TFIIIB Brf1 subunit/transcription initiation factor TFIIB